MRVPRAHAPVTPDAPPPPHAHLPSVQATGTVARCSPEAVRGREKVEKGKGMGEGEGEADIATGTGLLRGRSIRSGYLAMYSMYNM